MTEQLISSKGEIKRLPLSIVGLDENMEGGVPRNANVLISGSAGTMKSSICFNALYNEAKAGNNVLYISMEETYVSLLNQMINMGYDFNTGEIIAYPYLRQYKTSKLIAFLGKYSKIYSLIDKSCLLFLAV